MTINQETYQHLLTKLVQEQMIILGPSIGLDIARQIKNLRVDENGNVLKILSDPQQILNDINKLYIEISPHTTRNTLLTLLTKYPDIQKPVL
ncbi:hypothetical protein COW99_02290 [Candidatus Roizmanbacteria bacterium CG22_combo_CG10-13_8_21_14_all_38_20]|uniref:Uncharacterized protein n=1 Tax=Candidatus Roizmanbacteria bacterium CG22_combo_CG10-13_8_21_14_all_38_20 TaxID=1974862 RepID=A0A2H0BVZ6_9BACT|nr:hypothetical protein [Candidatus Microgenomates bacterium]PIP61774.1 MAG: hypothetical protein COW99_02290 [Candidatus Roizmanbacteria bacterium CG22_combo_CG10-13_8_21_14_all_38_20]PJC30979.1 MAG: hypothetical protein CO050_04590 [Candidatus Roizmanbacteria bacterium CG_4_9_14_0_2_um_filter_38_17]